MRGLLAVLLIGLATISFAEVGDVYYCNTVSISAVQSGELKQYGSEKFKFKWNEASIEFGDGDGYFKNTTAPITKGYPSIETFYGGKDYDHIRFIKGRFRYVYVSNKEPYLGGPETLTIVANCDKF